MEPKINEVCKYLRPEGGWVTNGLEYDGIVFIECDPFTKEEFDAAIPKVADWLAEQEIQVTSKREAALSKLAALGLTADDLKALGL